MADMATYIDHTLLKPNATKNQVSQLVNEAKQYNFKSVCVNPYWVPFCSEQLKDTSVAVCTVIGFPLGATTTHVKVLEAKQAVQDGAQEIDMVINIGVLKSGDDATVKKDIQAVVEAVQEHAIVKVIIETALLEKDEKVRACQLAKEAGADFVKTSTGFSGGGATVEDVALMRQTVGKEVGVKASGGVRDKQTAESMITAGATRIGTSSGISIIKE